jgi:phosphomannomutase
MLFENLKVYVKLQDLIIGETEEDTLLVKNMEGWYLIRISQTENALSVRCEGVNQDALGVMQDKLEEALSAVGLSMW